MSSAIRAPDCGAAATQLGHRLHRWGRDLVWEEFHRPEPEPGELLVAVEACGVGLSVLNWMRGDLADDAALLPRVPGHELVGRVVLAGSPADEDLLGRRVIAHAYLFCGRCPACLAGQENRCANLGGWIGLHRDGGYAPFAAIPARNAVPVADDVDPASATVVPDAVSTSVHVCRSRVGITPEDRVAVIGAGGGVGIHLIQVARRFGARVAGIDIDPGGLAAIERLGVRSVDARELERVRASSLWDAAPPTVVIDLVGAEATLSWSLDALGTGGRLVVLTTFPGRGVRVDVRALVLGERSILASLGATRAEYGIAADLVARGDVEPVIGSVRAPEHVEEIHAQIEDGTLVGRGAIVWGQERAGADSR